MQTIINKIVLLSIVYTLISCGNKEEKREQDLIQKEANTADYIFVTKAQYKRSNMKLGSIQEKIFPSTVKTSGMIDVPPENRAVVNATMGGYIKTTPLLIGDEVRKGQALVTIENPEFIRLQQEYMEVNGQLTYLKAEFERQQTMIAEQISSQKSFLKAESDYKTAKARYSGLGKQLSMLNISTSKVEAGEISAVVTIYAPIAGSITKVNVTRGTYVSPATVILEIIDNNHIHLELSVFEKDIMKLNKGQEINFKIPESSTETYQAEVHLIGSAIEDNRTIKVHGHLKDESAANFLTGMFVDAAIVIASDLSKAIPETAVLNIEDRHVVLKLAKENTAGYYFEQVEVKVGATYEGNIALKSSEKLVKTDKVLTKGAFNLITNE